MSVLPALGALVVAIWWMHLLATRFLEQQLDQLAPLVPSAMLATPRPPSGMMQIGLGWQIRPVGNRGIVWHNGAD